MTLVGALQGSCHCGAISLALITEHTPAELPVRICGCTFCQRHRPRYTSDPAGRVVIRAEASALSRYRFGLRLADFLLCRTCGVFVAAYETAGRAVINLDVLARAPDFVSEPSYFTGYDSEDVAARTARRARSWTPAELIVSEQSPLSLERFPVHLGLGATAVREPEFLGMEWYAEYAARHAADGLEGRLVSMHSFASPWSSWEMHPNGAELVVCTAGEFTLHQEGAPSVTLRPGEGAINPPGVWHTADAEIPSTAMFITAGVGTENRPR